MPKLSKQAGIELIVAELQKGTATSDIFGVIRSKSELAESTFYEWLKIAKEQHSVIQNSINELKAKEYTVSELSRQKSTILEREKAIEMVSNVAKIMYNKIAKENKTADVMAFNSTIERLAKMDGWDKPTKQEQTITDKRQGIVDFEIE
jgi:hypothetical protein